MMLICYQTLNQRSKPRLISRQASLYLPTWQRTIVVFTAVHCSTDFPVNIYSDNKYSLYHSTIRENEY